MIQWILGLKNKKGFTLIELIVVIAIIAILILIAVPAYQAYVTRSRQSSMDASAATIAKAAAIYAATENVTLPTYAQIADLVDTAEKANYGTVSITANADGGFTVSVPHTTWGVTGVYP